LALLSDTLSIWDIAFRWAGLDPDKFWFQLPLPVRDNFRVLMQAILEGEILCETLTLAKLPSDSKADPNYYIRTHIDDVYNCIWGKKYNRKLFKWAVIERYSLKEWCEIRAIPLPEFWFPPGWKDDFEMPEGSTMALRARHQEPGENGYFSIRYERPFVDDDASNSKDLEEVPTRKVRDNQRIKLCCQQMAAVIWKEQPDCSIASMVKDERIQKYGGAAHYEDDTVYRWLKPIAPQSARRKPGRPPKNRDKDSK
jgi:hypothetical protein